MAGMGSYSTPQVSKEVTVTSAWRNQGELSENLQQPSYNNTVIKYNW